MHLAEFMEALVFIFLITLRLLYLFLYTIFITNQKLKLNRDLSIVFMVKLSTRCLYLSPLILFVFRLFGGKAAKQATVTENLKNSVVISNPHATLGHHSVPPVGLLDSPSAGSSVGAGGSEQVSSPGSGYSGGTGTWGHPSVSSMHTSTESIDMSVSSGHQRDSGHQPITRTGSTRTER